MQRVVSILILLASLTFLAVTPALAGFFSADTLVTIDGTEYEADDFKRWWKYWQEEDTPVPESPKTYIDWLLLAREGKRMELDENPGFKRQTRIFLQARGLLKLKYEEVDSKIEVTDEDIRKRYEERFTPIWLLQRLEYQTAEEALEAWQLLESGEVTVQELLERSPQQGGPIYKPDDWLRPGEINPAWRAILSDMEVGDVLDPEEHNTGYDLFYLKAVKQGSEEDLAELRETIEGDLWKEQENRLTSNLIKRLRDKYEVEVDEERLASLDLMAADEAFGDEPVITTNRTNVSEKDFKAVVDRLLSSRPAAAHALKDEKETEKLKKDTAHNIIAQSVTNWESLDRHYEEQEPFKWLYQFNYNHRLVKAVEEILFESKAEVTDAEIEQHYEENLDRFTQPTMVKVHIFDETQIPVDKVWAEVAVGKDFKKVVQEHLERRIEPREVPANHLDPEVKEAIEDLGVGETSRIFEAQDLRVMVHLEDRTRERTVPLKRVKDSIRSSLKKEKVKQLREEHLEQIKTGSEIEIEEGTWEDIKEDLEESDEA